MPGASRATFALLLTAGLLLLGVAAGQSTPGADEIVSFGASLEGALYVLNNGTYNGTDVMDDTVDPFALVWDNVYAGPSPLLAEAKPTYYVVAQAESDVVTALEFAIMFSIKPSIVANAHQQAQVAYIENGLVIDVSNLQDIEVDPQARTITFQPGAVGGQIANATAPYNLLYPVAHASGVGISGYTLGGGEGWNGYAVDFITGFDVVNIWQNSTDGLEIVHVNATSYPELFWAMRGAGQMLGFVTRFYANLEQITADNIRSTTAIFPLPLATAGFNALFPAYNTLVKDLESSIVLAHTPQGPAGIFSQYIYHAKNATLVSALQDGLATAGRAHAVAVIPANLTYEQLVVSADATQDYDGVASYTQALVIGNMTAEVFDIALGLIANATSNNSIVGVFPPTYSPLNNTDTAFGWRGYWQIWVWAFWTRTDGGAAVDGDAQHIGWARSGAAALKPYTIGQYLNMATYTSPNDTRSSFPATNWARIVKAKQAYDPNNLARELDYYRMNNAQSAQDGSSDGAVGAANGGIGSTATS